MIQKYFIRDFFIYIVTIPNINRNERYDGTAIFISPASSTFNTLIVIFRKFPNWKYHFRLKSRTAGCDVQWLYILQSNRS